MRRWVAIIALTLGACASPPPPGGGPLGECVSSLKNLDTALMMYASDYPGAYPTSLSRLTPEYVKEIPRCPTGGSYAAVTTGPNGDAPDFYTLWCTGDHQPQGLPPGFPQFTSQEGLIEKP
ncbi:MAG: hypothetical protein AB1758_14835 [Candidatus Eremiobacterota bacterium]